MKRIYAVQVRYNNRWVPSVEYYQLNRAKKYIAKILSQSQVKNRIVVYEKVKILK